jgi:hypothetical protein
MRSRANESAVRRERKNAAARLDAHLAEERMRAALDLDRKLRVGHCASERRALRIEHADQARTLAGQRERA